MPRLTLTEKLTAEIKASYYKSFATTMAAQAKRGSAPQLEVQVGDDFFEEIAKLVEENLTDKTGAKTIARQAAKQEYCEFGLTYAWMQSILRKNLNEKYTWLIARRFEGKTPHR